jgi:hypothetical protein
MNTWALCSSYDIVVLAVNILVKVCHFIGAWRDT